MPDDEAFPIGPRLRAARTRRGLSIAGVAATTGLTKGFLSLLERDRTTASVASLVRICRALDIPVASLFEPPRTAVVRHAERSPIDFGGEGLTEWLLTPGGQSALQVIESHVAPGGGSGDEAYSLGADAEWVHVLDGELEIAVDGERQRLAAGDSMTFSARDARHWRNPSQTMAAHVLWVITPVPR